MIQISHGWVGGARPHEVNKCAPMEGAEYSLESHILHVWFEAQGARCRGCQLLLYCLREVAIAEQQHRIDNDSVGLLRGQIANGKTKE